MDADEVAATIAFLLSPRQRSITGTTIAVDGGIQGLRLSADVEQMINQQSQFVE